MKSYKFKLYPTEEQKEKLELSLDICRRTYNHLLSELSNGFRKNELSNYLLDLKVCYPEMKQVYSKVLQVENDKLFSNLSGLSASKKNGNKVGRLRFKGKGWKKTFCYNQSGFKILKGNKKSNKLRLSKIGDIKLILHRKLEGKIKQVIIKREIDNWYAIIQTDAVIKLECGNKEIGIDMSPSKFGVRSDGIKMEMPKEIDISLKKIKKPHRILSRKKKGSNNRLKAKKLLQKRYWRLNNQKGNFYHQTSHRLIKECKIIGIEDLNIKGMMKGYYSAVNFQKSGWSTFINKYLIYKAESANCQIWQCDRFEPTTQRCSMCGKINPVRLELKDRIFSCPFCSLVLDRDDNASKNINKYCRQGTCLCGMDSSTLEKEQESVLKQEKTSVILNHREALTSTS